MLKMKEREKNQQWQQQEKTTTNLFILESMSSLYENITPIYTTEALES